MVAEEGVEVAVTATFGVEEREEVDAGEGVVVLRKLVLAGRRGYHFATCVAEVLEGLTVFVEVGVEWAAGRGGVEFHEEVRDQV